LNAWARKLVLTIAFISVTLNMAVPTVLICVVCVCVTVILRQVAYSFSCENFSNINRALGMERMGENAE